MLQSERCWRIGMPAMAGMLTIAFAAAPLKISVPDPIPSPPFLHAESIQEPGSKGDGPWVSPSFRVGLIASYVEVVRHNAGLKKRAAKLERLIATLEARRLTEAEELVLEAWLPEDLSDRERAALETRLKQNPPVEEQIGIEVRLNADLTEDERVAVEEKLLRNKAIDVALGPLRGELSGIQAELRQSTRIEEEVFDAIVEQRVTDDVVQAVNEYMWNNRAEAGRSSHLGAVTVGERNGLSGR